jgi:hypothetical protein
MNYKECKQIVEDVIFQRKVSNFDKNIIWHKHHIIPKHFNGGDEIENIIDVTSNEHAEIHKRLYEKYNHKQDWLAWQGLSGFLGKEEIIKESIKIGSSKAGKKGGQKAVESGRIFEMSKLGVKKIREQFSSEDEYKKYFSKISSLQKGVPKDKLKNYLWITDGKINKKIKKTDIIPNGFVKGRTKIWKTNFSIEKKEIITCPYCNKVGGKPVMKRFHFDNCKKK